MERLIRTLAMASMTAIVYASCIPEGVGSNNPSENDVVADKEYVITLDAGNQHESLGVWVTDQDGKLVDDVCTKAEQVSSGLFRCVLTLPEGTVPAGVYVLTPYQTGLKAVDGRPVVRVISSGVAGMEVPQVYVSASPLGGDGTELTAELTFSPVLRASSVRVEGLETTDKIHLLSLKTSKKVSGLAVISDAGEVVPIEPSASASDILGFSFPEGSTERTASFNLISSDYTPLSYSVITSDSYMEGEVIDGKVDVTSAKSVSSATTFDFVGKDGRVMPETGNGYFNVVSSSDGAKYRFALENGSLQKGRGLVLSSDQVSSGTLELPTIEERQITRMIFCLDGSSGTGLQSVWLECYDGENWGKLEGTHLRSDIDVTATNGNILDFVLPKDMISAAGVYRLFCMGEGESLCLRSVTILHEKETCSHHPMSLIDDGFSKWKRCGTNISADNNFYPDELVVVDKNVSHVDDGSGSLKFIAPTCTNNYKPWIGWRYPTMNVEAGATYRIYFCVKTENLPTNASLFLSIGFKNASKTWLTGWVPGLPDKNGLDGKSSLWIDTVKGTHDWMKLSAEITAPEGAVYLDYFQFMLQNVINAPDAYVWFDDINMIRVN